jgi:hypothetical protein
MAAAVLMAAVGAGTAAGAGWQPADRLAPADAVFDHAMDAGADGGTVHVWSAPDGASERMHALVRPVGGGGTPR